MIANLARARLTVTLGIAVCAAMVSVGATSASALVPPTTTTIVNSSANPSVVGQAVTFTATVTKSLGGTPAGTVQFLDAGALLNTLPLVGGAAQIVTSSLTQGSHGITAVFVPANPLDLTTPPSVSAVLTQVVNTATGGGGGGGGICIPGVTPPTPVPTISAPARVVGPHAVSVHGTALANDPVDLLVKPAGASTGSKVASVIASASGTYSFARNVSKQTAFSVQDRGACGTKTSATVLTKVALAVGLIAKSPKKGKLRLSATTAPKAPNQLVRFYRVKSGKRVLLAKVATSAKGTAHKTIAARSGKRYRVIATVHAPSGNLPGQSKRVAVRVK